VDRGGLGRDEPDTDDARKTEPDANDAGRKSSYEYDGRTARKDHEKAANTLCEMAKQELEHAKELYEMFEEAKAVKAFKEHEEVVKYIGEELHEEIEEWESEMK